MTILTKNFQTTLKPTIAVLALVVFLALPLRALAHNPPLPASGVCPAEHSVVGTRCFHDEPTPPPGGGGAPAANDALGTVSFPAGFNLDASKVLNNLVGVFIAIGGLIFFFMLLFGGIRFMTAGGDPKNSESARKTITNAVLGLIIVVSAYLVTTILGELLGINFLKPVIPGL